ncbi:hypothetical protein HPP92_020081 [Vanilla planifolia]|uniref:Calcium uniporter protein C-terminal domain-containing protein n=1 Tax=Vanilla planifolia TaxID=51239 RepID=A0A835QAX7_VANPL|nr:hypothetical protein HPP92_020081 [Vanilla planifolia]
MGSLCKMLSGRFLHLAKHSSTFTAAVLPMTDRSLLRSFPSGDANAASPANHRILLQRRPISKSLDTSASQTSLPLPIGDNLVERIRSSMTWARDRIRPDAFPKPPRRSVVEANEESEEGRNRVVISVEDARRFLKASVVESARAKLRNLPSSCVSYSDFAEICRESAAGSDEFSQEIAAALQQSGTVLVLGDAVFLRPEQVVNAIARVIPLPMSPSCMGDDPRKNELKEMEVKKAAIDSKAEAQVRKELWAGMGVVLIQIAALMRLTFWELSWDVMEPICFFSTSIYFMLGYAFFLRTAKEPSFEGFFASRFSAKQKRLMKTYSFDLSRFDELRSALMPCRCSQRLAKSPTNVPSWCHCCQSQI